MRDGRYLHVMESVDSKLYVFGGMEDGGPRYLESIECYDTVSEQWTVVNNAKLATGLCSSFVGGNVFITGRLKNDPCTNAMIVEFDVNSNKIIKTKTGLPSQLGKHFSALMVLPQLL